MPPREAQQLARDALLLGTKTPEPELHLVLLSLVLQVHGSLLLRVAEVRVVLPELVGCLTGEELPGLTRCGGRHACLRLRGCRSSLTDGGRVVSLRRKLRGVLCERAARC